MNPEEFEQKLSSLSLARESEQFIHTGSRLIKLKVRQGKLASRLNYVLAFSLLLSVGFNMVQLMKYYSGTSNLSAQCEINNMADASNNSETYFAQYPVSALNDSNLILLPTSIARSTQFPHC